MTAQPRVPALSTRVACLWEGTHAASVAEVAKTSGGPPGRLRIARILENSATVHAKRIGTSPCRAGGSASLTHVGLAVPNAND